MGADAVDPQEQQRRELEEIRRSFKEIGDRMGPLFEPAPPDEPEQLQQPSDTEEAGPQEPAVARPAADRSIEIWALPVVVALLWLLVGTGLGYLLHRPATVAARAPTTSVVVRPEPQVVAPPACLEAVRRGDETVELLLTNVRDRRLSLALKAYTKASQACRKQASP